MSWLSALFALMTLSSDVSGEDQCTGCKKGTGKGLKPNVNEQETCSKCVARDAQLFAVDYDLRQRLLRIVKAAPNPGEEKKDDGMVDITDEENFPGFLKDLSSIDKTDETAVMAVINDYLKKGMKKETFSSPGASIMFDAAAFPEGHFEHAKLYSKAFEVLKEQQAPEIRVKVSSAISALDDHSFIIRGMEPTGISWYDANNPYMMMYPEYTDIAMARFGHCPGVNQIEYVLVDLPCIKHGRSNEAPYKANEGIIPLAAWKGVVVADRYPGTGPDGYEYFQRREKRNLKKNQTLHFSPFINSVLTQKFIGGIPAELVSVLDRYVDDASRMDAIVNYTPPEKRGKKKNSCKVTGCDGHADPAKVLNHEKNIPKGETGPGKGTKRARKENKKYTGKQMTAFKQAYGTTVFGDILSLISKTYCNSARITKRVDLVRMTDRFEGGVLKDPTKDTESELIFE